MDKLYRPIARDETQRDARQPYVHTFLQREFQERNLELNFEYQQKYNFSKLIEQI